MKNFKPLFALTLIFLSAIFVFAQNRVRTYDVQHYVIRSSFDRANKIYFGDSTIQLKPLNKNFNSVVLDAAGIQFESIKVEPSGANLKYNQAGNKLTINLDKAYSPDDLISIRFKYSAKPKKGIYFVDATERHSSQVWTQGEPEEAHHWLPSYDFPDDKATTEHFITIPKDEVAIGNGELLSETENADGTKTFHFKMPVQHSVYLISFVVGKYVKVEEKYKNIPLGYYVYPGHEDLVKRAYSRTADILRVFEELTGVDYPFNKYDQTMVAKFNFGGMENITATTMADTEIMASAFMPGAVMDLVSHEIAHSWFGNLVTCRNWSELWLNEGFASFLEAAYREKAFGRDDYNRKIREDADRAIAYDAVPWRRHPLYNLSAKPNDSLFTTTTYQKGSAVVHTLREAIGDQAFWKGVNIYLNRHKFENVETPDLKKAMEEASGKDLTWFFDQWVYKGGFPQLTVQQSYNPTTKKLSLTVTQNQKADTVTPAVFVLPLEIEIQTAAGTKTELLNINKRTQVFSVQLKDKPTRIRLDKDEKIPLKVVKISPLATMAAR
jgi:aminopeptidase N